MDENQNNNFEIRLASNQDVTAAVALIGKVLVELGDQICLEGSEADLLNIEANFFGKSGAFWVIDRQVADTDGSTRDDEQATPVVFGTHATLPDPDRPNVCNFKRLYVDASLRGTDWSQRLMQTTIDWARLNQFERVEFWSDTRFHRAHRFFEKFDFVKTGEVRTMNDSHEPYQEYFFYLSL